MSKQEQSQEQVEKRPFAADSTKPYAKLNKAQRSAVAKRIAKDWGEGGLSGNELREKFGEQLTGPTRRVVLRDHGYGALVGRSYNAYRDGETRQGTRHAREHGPKASERRAELEAEAAKKAKRQAASKKAAATRKAKAAAATAVIEPTTDQSGDAV